MSHRQEDIIQMSHRQEDIIQMSHIQEERKYMLHRPEDRKHMFNRQEDIKHMFHRQEDIVTVSYIFCRNIIIYPCKCLIRNLCKFRQKICETFGIKMRQFSE